ncbi:MAG: DUF3900 domain-containing protein [Pyrinomonadaceae bacterium]
MPRTKSIKNLEWEHRFAAIFKCSSKASDPTEVVVADKTAISGNENLQRVLKALQHDLIFKQIYVYAKNPTTRFLTFRKPKKGQPNKAQPLLNALIAAKHKKQMEAQAEKLAHQYMLTKNIQNGLLIFLVSEGKIEDKIEGTCAFVFKCDFEEISQLTEKKVFRKIEDAIVEKTKKGALYPYYDDGRFDDTSVRVFDEFGETQYWLDFLDLGVPPARFPQLPAVTLEEWEQVRPEVATKYQERIQELSVGRSLAERDLFTQPEDRLSPKETENVIEAVTAKAGKQNVNLQLDKVRFTVPLDEYGKTWILAEQAGMHFVLAKGSDLQMRTDMLNPIDLAATLNLKQAVEKLNIPL